MTHDALAARLSELLANVAETKAAYDYELRRNGGGYAGERTRLAWVNALADMRNEAGNALPALLADLTAANARVKEAEGVIAPFVAAAETMNDVGGGAFPVDGQASIYTGYDEETDAIIRVTVDDFRKAAQWLADREGRSDG